MHFVVYSVWCLRQKKKTNSLPHLVPAVPLGLLALVGELAREGDLQVLLGLHLLVNRLLDPLKLLLQVPAENKKRIRHVKRRGR